jgi:asparagine synthase (glutamine-hydrolysing)
VSVNFNEASFDERPYQAKVLGRTSAHNHKSYVVTEQMFRDSWAELWLSMDQPSIDGVNTYFVSQAAHNSGLKAVLSGLGADEHFGGYDSSFRISWIKSLRNVPAKKRLARMLGSNKDAFRRLAFLEIPGPVGDYLFLRGVNTPDAVAKILQCSEAEVWDLLKGIYLAVPHGLSDFDYASFLETNLYMRNQLLKDTDFMSMGFGLEVRVPFLDEDLVRTVHEIGLEGNVMKSQPKFLLTSAFADLLPAEVIHRKKQGFVFPFRLWIANAMRSEKVIVSEELKARLDIDRFLNGNAHWSKVWSGIVLENFKV